MSQFFSAGLFGSAIPDSVVDNFEIFPDGPYDENGETLSDFYTGDLSNWDRVQSASVIDGDYSLDINAPADFIYSTSGLPRYPESGRAFSFYIRDDDTSNSGPGVRYGIQDENNHYGMRLLVDGGDFQIRKDSSTQEGIILSLSFNTWYECEVRWGSGEITQTLYEIDQTTGERQSELGSVSLTDSEYTSGGVGYFSSSGSSDGSRFDAVYVIPADVFENINPVFVEQSIDTERNSTETAVHGLLFSDDGETMWWSSPTFTSLFEYTLSTPWDISTATETAEFDTSANTGTNIQEPTFNDDGTVLHIPDLTGEIYQYTLSTPYDITTMSFDTSITFNYEAEEHPTCVEWNSDGTTAIIMAGQEDDVTQWDASTPYDITTLSFNQAYDLQQDLPGDKVKAARIYDGGTQMFVPHDGTAKEVYRFELGSPYDLSSVTVQDSLDVSAETDQLLTTAVRPDGSNLYIADNTDPRRIVQYG